MTSRGCQARKIKKSYFSFWSLLLVKIVNGSRGGRVWREYAKDLASCCKTRSYFISDVDSDACKYDANIYDPRSLTLRHVCMMHISMILVSDLDACMHVWCNIFTDERTNKQADSKSWKCWSSDKIHMSMLVSEGVCMYWHVFATAEVKGIYYSRFQWDGNMKP